MIHNTGLSPAIQVVFEAEVFDVPLGASDFLNRRIRLCETAARGLYGGGDSISPSGEQPYRRILTITANDITRDRARGHAFPVVIVCVGYGAAFKENAGYHTGSLYVLSDRTEPMRMTIDRYIPIDGLALRPFMMAGTIVR
jgi:hypothetical protein